jgi:hypothetical protein
MFVVLRKENGKSTVIGLRGTPEEAKQKMLDEATKRGKREENKTDEGTFFTYNEQTGTIEEYKNTIKITPGYIYGETREVITAPTAEYFIVDVSDEVRKEQYIYEDNKRWAAREKIYDEILESIKKVYTDRTTEMTLLEAIKVGRQVQNIKYDERLNKLMAWCEERKDNADILNLMGYIKWRILSENNAAREYFVMAAKKGCRVAIYNIQQFFPDAMANLVVQSEKKPKEEEHISNSDDEDSDDEDKEVTNDITGAAEKIELTNIKQIIANLD